MRITETFQALVLLLLIDPVSDRVDELLAELAAQAAQGIHDSSTEHLLLRCVRWDNPYVYYALDALLHQYDFQLTGKPGPVKGTTILGIKPHPNNSSAPSSHPTPTKNSSTASREGVTA